MSLNKLLRLHTIFYGVSFFIFVLWLGIFRNREQIIQVSLLLLSIATYLIAVVMHIKPLRQAKKIRVFRIAISVLFFVYILILMDVLFIGNLFLTGGRNGGAVNLIPFQSIKNNLNDILSEHSLWSAVNLFGNILLFVPLGICLPIIFDKLRNFSLFAIAAITFLVAVEIAQNVTQTGSTDIDDFILNFGGAILAWLITNCMIKRIGRIRLKDALG